MDDTKLPQESKPQPTVEERIAGAKFDIRCPHCGMDPITINARDVAFGPILVMVVSCLGCRNVLGAGFHAQMDPRVVGRQSVPGLVR